MRSHQSTTPQHDTLGTLRFDARAAPSRSGRSPSSEASIFPGGRRPIVARLRRADGRTYGRPDGSDLRSFGALSTDFFANWPMQIGGFQDIGGMRENSAQSETFFTEHTLAAYLAVSDRTIRNWIRRGELPSYKLGAAKRIDPADVDAFLAERRDEAA
jgi:excisionase family DNA binding protein